MADSMEVMILSILSPALHCDWGISQYKQAMLTTGKSVEITPFSQTFLYTILTNSRFRIHFLKIPNLR